MMNCKHLSRIGDNNGVSCMDCGAQLSGYGYWGQFKVCIHSWITMGGVGEQYLMCTYCEREMNLPTQAAGKEMQK